MGLNRDPREVPSPFIGKPAPEFSLPRLSAPEKRISSKQLLGEVWLFNVWASWCAACLVEHPLLNQLSQADFVKIIGLNYKDTQVDADNWLQQHGNPYAMTGFDRLGDVGIDYGVYGVPETFVIDKAGLIRLKHIGPLTGKDIEDTIIPLVERLKGENS